MLTLHPGQMFIVTTLVTNAVAQCPQFWTLTKRMKTFFQTHTEENTMSVIVIVQGSGFGSSVEYHLF